VQFTEDWFAYDDAIAMRTWLEEAIRTELFGPAFENSGPWELTKSSRRDWIAPQASRRVSEEREQLSALMYDNPPRIRGSPHSRQSNSATEHMDTHRGVQEGTITPNTDGSPARSKTKKQLEMEGHRDFIQECAVEDQEWKWSPVYLLLRDFSDLSRDFPRPWKHTAKEWSQIQTCIDLDFNLFRRCFEPSSIVVALQLTWKLHFSENITDVDLNALSETLEQVSQEKEFGSNLSRVGELMRSEWHEIVWDDKPDMKLWNDLWVDMCEPTVRASQEQQILANDIAFFKAPLETPGHQEVMKRICNHLVGIAGRAMVKDCPEFLKDMWIAGCPKNEQEMLLRKWKEIVYDSYCTLYLSFTIYLY
jgi:hypothetical protein